MESYQDSLNFQPKDEEKRQRVEHYNALSMFISEKIRALAKKDRLQVLRQLNQTLRGIYLQAMKNEDYETCAVAKTLLEERGFEIPALETPK